MKNTMADYKKFHTEVQLYEGPTWKHDNNGSGQGIEDLTNYELIVVENGHIIVIENSSHIIKLAKYNTIQSIVLI